MKLTRKLLRAAIQEAVSSNIYPKRERRVMTLHIDYARGEPVGPHELITQLPPDPVKVIFTVSFSGSSLAPIPAKIPPSDITQIGHGRIDFNILKPNKLNPGSFEFIPDHVVAVAKYNNCDQILDSYLGYPLKNHQWREEYRGATGI